MGLRGTRMEPRPHMFDHALALAQTHSEADVLAGVAAGQLQRWGGEDSIIVTEIRDTPKRRTINFFLAEGHMPELQAMTPAILDWARLQGCTHASLVGREGWRRVPWLLETGWRFEHIVMGREL
jgi:hypothetical protein